MRDPSQSIVIHAAVASASERAGGPGLAVKIACGIEAAPWTSNAVADFPRIFVNVAIEDEPARAEKPATFVAGGHGCGAKRVFMATREGALAMDAAIAGVGAFAGGAACVVGEAFSASAGFFEEVADL